MKIWVLGRGASLHAGVAADYSIIGIMWGMWGRNSELKRKDKRAKPRVFSVEMTVLEFSKIFFCHAATNCLFQMM